MEEEDLKINWSNTFWYFVFFSILGLIIETVYCYATMGILESRKGLVWGPFCPIYGVGASILIIVLSKYKNSYIKLFAYGAVLGDVIEYILSYCMEALYGSRFWEYSYVNLNLNGRICITYSIFWGILAVILIKIMKPLIDTILNKIKPNIKRVLEKTILAFLIIDVLATVWAVSTYETRAKQIYYGIQNQQTEIEDVTAINKFKKYIEENVFSNEKMKKTFPNIRFTNRDGQEIYIRDII